MLCYATVPNAITNLSASANKREKTGEILVMLLAFRQFFELLILRDVHEIFNKEQKSRYSEAKGG